MTLGSSYKLLKNYMVFCPSYNLPKIFKKIKIKIKNTNKQTKIKPRSTYPKTLNSEARLWNEKVLVTNSA